MKEAMKEGHFGGYRRLPWFTVHQSAIWLLNYSPL